MQQDDYKHKHPTTCQELPFESPMATFQRAGAKADQERMAHEAAERAGEMPEMPMPYVHDPDQTKAWHYEGRVARSRGGATVTRADMTSPKP